MCVPSFVHSHIPSTTRVKKGVAKPHTHRHTTLAVAFHGFKTQALAFRCRNSSHVLPNIVSLPCLSSFGMEMCVHGQWFGWVTPLKPTTFQRKVSPSVPPTHHSRLGQVWWRLATGPHTRARRWHRLKAHRRRGSLPTSSTLDWTWSVWPLEPRTMRVRSPRLGWWTLGSVLYSTLLSNQTSPSSHTCLRSRDCRRRYWSSTGCTSHRQCKCCASASRKKPSLLDKAYIQTSNGWACKKELIFRE